MFEYYQTTGLILLWTIVISLFSCIGAYVITKKFTHWLALFDLIVIHQPALSLGALSIFLAYKFFHLNLLFPVHLLTGLKELMLSAFVPALILNLASGLSANILKITRNQYLYWKEKSFYQTRRALGLDPSIGVRRIVILKTFVNSWSNCIPWVFGEILIIESVFNAPGIGLAIWHQARIRDLESMIYSALWFFLLYSVVYLFTILLHNWLGKKLEGYV